MTEKTKQDGPPDPTQRASDEQERSDPPHDTNEELVRFFATHSRPLVSFLRVQKKQSFEDARDIAQEAFTRLCAALKTGSGRLEPLYLYRIAINLVIDGFRQRSRRDQHAPKLLPELDLRAADSETTELTDQQITQLCMSVSELPEPHQRAFRLWYVEGRRQRQIAIELKVSTRTITTYISEATCYCRLRLDGISAHTAKERMKK